MKISIVIPTYNGEIYIEETIKSALSQSRHVDEIIISDDKSTDRTLEICNKYKDRIKIVQNHKGPSGFVNGWNNAIKHASCDFISILHQDDLLAPTFVEEVEKAHELHPDVKHIVSICNYIDGNGQTIRKSSHNNGNIQRYTGCEYSDLYILNSNDHINRCPGVVTHRDIFKHCTYRPEAGHIADDDFFMRVGNYTDVVCIHKPLAYYREHTSSETGHLKEIELVSRLVDDYALQCNEIDKNPILSSNAKLQIKNNEAFFIRRLFLYSLKYLKPYYTYKSIHRFFKSLKREKYKNLNLFFTFN